MPVLLVAATGGHLAQLHRLAPRIPGADESRVWVTFDTPQSCSLLKHEQKIFVPYTAPRDLVTAMRNTRTAYRIIQEVRPSLVASTGNAVAVSFLPVARLLGVPAAYIESAARAEGPSLTGKILRRMPGIQLFSQYEQWAEQPWTFAGSVFDAYSPAPRDDKPTLRRIVVTLGTIGFGFRRLVERVLQIVPDGCEVVWQVGDTDVTGLPIAACRNMASADLQDAMRNADVVIAHAGIGSALAALDAGKCPILVPRESRHAEHIDDHQRQIASRLDGLRLAVHRPVSSLGVDDLEAASRVRVTRSTYAPPLAIRL